MLISNRASLRIGLALAVSALLFAACGASSSDSTADGEIATLATATIDELATGDGATAVGAAADAGVDDERTFEDAQLDFSACMRDSGYPEWPDPDPNAEGGPFGGVDVQALGIDFNDDAFRTVLDTCREELQGVVGDRQELDPEQQAERQDQTLALFACIRTNPGWEDLPDPDLTGGAGGGGDGIRALFQSGDYDIDEFRTLSQQCQTELGIEGGGFGGGQGGGGQGGGRGPGGDPADGAAQAGGGA